MQPALSELDTIRFGVITARAEVRQLDDVDDCVNFCQAHGVRLLIVRCATSAIAAVQRLENDGARLMDCQVLYGRDFSTHPFTGIPAHLDYVRKAQDADVQGVAEVAAAAFSGYSGHYHADVRLRAADSTDAYADWAVRLCAHQDDRTVFVAGRDGAVAGFAAVREGVGNEAEIVLAAVAPQAQGAGIPNALAFAAEQWSVQRGLPRVIVWTKITNLPIQRVMVRHAYEVVSSAFVLHKWYEG